MMLRRPPISCFSARSGSKHKRGPTSLPTGLKTLGDHLRKRRLELGLRQKDVAKALSVDETTVNNWERHRTEPTARLTLRIVRFLEAP